MPKGTPHRCANSLALTNTVAVTGHFREVAHQSHDLEIINSSRRIAADDVHNEATPHFPEPQAKRLAVDGSCDFGLHGLSRKRLIDNLLKVLKTLLMVLSGMHGRQRPSNKRREANDVL